MKRYQVIGLVALISTAASFAACLTAGDEETAHQTYCENVALWESDPAPELDRIGHPNFKDISCHKDY